MGHNLKIKDIKENTDNIEVEGYVVEKEAAHDVVTRFGPAKLAKAVIKDDTGTIRLNLWRQQVDIVFKGDRIKLEKAFAQTFNDQLELNVGGAGKITVLKRRD